MSSSEMVVLKSCGSKITKRRNRSTASDPADADNFDVERFRFICVTRAIGSEGLDQVICHVSW